MSFDVEDWALLNLSKVHPSAGHEVEAECPFCGKAGKFYLNTDTHSWICFSCDERGRSIVRVFAKVEGLSEEEARRVIFRKAVQFKRRQSDPATVLERLAALRPGVGVESPQVNVELPEEYIPIWQGRKCTMPTYLLDRGITRKSALFWKMGYCNGGRYTGRIIVPIVCPSGKSFTARDTGDHPRKYLNPPGADHRRLLFGYDEAGVDGDVALVEGAFDVARNRQNGMTSVGIFGKNLHPEQLRLLYRWPATRVVHVMLDPEAEDEAVAVAMKLKARFQQVYLDRLPPDIDPGKATRLILEKTIQEAEKFAGERLRIVKQRLSRTRKSRVQD